MKPRNAARLLGARLDIAGLFPFGALCDLEYYFLTFFQCLKAGHVDRGKVREQVFSALIWSNESETFAVVEPFHFTLSHYFLAP